MSWHGWTVEPGLAYVVLAAGLYAVGGRGYRPATEQSRWRAVSFAAGLGTIVIALDSPLDGYADSLFWAHMSQHVLLLTLAPPLILLGRPWPRMWRAVPSGARVAVGRTLSAGAWTAPIRTLARPIPAWILFNVTILAWHIPGAYNATLTSGAVHDLEHAMFFFTGLLFWARVVDPGPLRPRLNWLMRTGYVIGAMVIGWGLAITLVLVPEPIYSYYALLAHRPGGISALSDQQLAAGIMWVPGSLSYGVAMFLAFYRWLEPVSPGRPERAALTI